jgi:hypothetical protein
MILDGKPRLCKACNLSEILSRPLQDKGYGHARFVYAEGKMNIHFSSIAARQASHGRRGGMV